jgi:hypothetical protein
VLNDFVWSIFQGYKEVKDSRDPYEELAKAPLLYEVDDLNKLTNQAKTREQYETILDHIYKFGAAEQGQFGYFKRIENKIIDKMWDL